MVKIRQKRFLKLKFSIIKKTHIPVFVKKIWKPWIKLSCQFLKKPWVLMVSGMCSYGQKSKKIPNSLHLSGHVIPPPAFLAGDCFVDFELIEP
jgi:hypothetical protein